jgi:hypothetical protein
MICGLWRCHKPLYYLGERGSRHCLSGDSSPFLGDKIRGCGWQNRLLHRGNRPVLKEEERGNIAKGAKTRLSMEAGGVDQH